MPYVNEGRSSLTATYQVRLRFWHLTACRLRMLLLFEDIPFFNCQSVILHRLVGLHMEDLTLGPHFVRCRRLQEVNNKEVSRIGLQYVVLVSVHLYSIFIMYFVEFMAAIQ